MACTNCGSFDPNYHGGYCDYHKRDTSPTDTCEHDDSKGSSYSNSQRCCDTCRSYDGDYYCRYQHIRVSPTDLCGSWS